MDSTEKPIPSQYDRPYNDQINEEADTKLFNKTFGNEDQPDAASESAISDPNKRTGIIFYKDCVEHFCTWDANFEECPRRFTRIMERIKQLELYERCQVFKPRKATENEILSVHSSEYLEKVAATSQMIDPDALEKEASKYDAVYFTPSTYECALYSAGSAVALVDQVVQKNVLNGFAIIRPPGHHAMRDKACGYCFFNNVAIAAKHCLDKCNMSRILIIDFDVHHGQATQQMFYNDPRVLYASIHRYQVGTFWPELVESNYNFVGEKNGRGFNVNIPLNDTCLCDSDYLAIWHNVLLPIFYEFNPELILVSAGFDAAIGCPQGEMLLTPTFYGHAVHSLMGLANGQVCVLLEGGYCIESLADSAAFTLRTLLGDPPIRLKMRYPINQSVVDTVLDSISALRSYWNVLTIQRTFNRHEADNDDTHLRKRYYPMIEYKGNFAPPPEFYETRNVCPVQTEADKAKFAQVINILRQHVESQFVRYEKRTCIINVPDFARKHSSSLTHPERYNRTEFLWKFLKSKNILNRCHIISDNKRQASREQLLLCHTEEAIEKVSQSELKAYKDLREYETQFDSIYFTKDTFQVVQTTVGSLLQVVDCVLTEKCLNGFACIRPPGHHASRNTPAGFCFFNNIAIAARYAREKYNLKRIMVLDWDVHHGDGTQDILKGDDSFLFVSLHRYDNASFYPEKIESNFSVCKNVINIPWNGGPMGDKEYMAAFFNIILPIGYNFNPDLVLISAGFDSAQGDPLGEYNVTPYAYGHMTHMLSTLANGKIILSLEGGYNLKSIADCAHECITVLLGDPPKPLSLDGERLNECAIQSIQNVIDYHADNYPCLRFNIDIPNAHL